MNIEKCEPHGFENCCNIVEPVLAATECLDYNPDECEGLVEYRMPMSGTGRSFARCGFHFDVRMDMQQRISRDYGVPMFYDGSDYDSDY